jgi:hypothetical protein
MKGAASMAPEQVLLRMLERGGFQDNLIDRILFAETAPHLTKPGEREFLGLLRRTLEKAAVKGYGLDDFPSFELSTYERTKLQGKFVAMNVLKVRLQGWEALRLAPRERAALAAGPGLPVSRR